MHRIKVFISSQHCTVHLGLAAYSCSLFTRRISPPSPYTGDARGALEEPLRGDSGRLVYEGLPAHVQNFSPLSPSRSGSAQEGLGRGIAGAEREGRWAGFPSGGERENSQFTIKRVSHFKPGVRYRVTSLKNCLSNRSESTEEGHNKT